MTDNVIAHEVVQVEHHMLALHDGRATAYPELPPSNGLVGVTQGMLIVFTGIAHGPVSLTVHARHLPPPALDQDAWDEIVDVSMTATADVCTDGATLPPLTIAGPGTYRVRVHARGRDTSPDATVTSPVEEYLIVAWPQPTGVDTVHQLTDSYGAQLRASTSIPGPTIRTDPEQQRRDDQLRRAGR